MSQKQSTSNVVLKRGPNGKFQISLTDFMRVHVTVPQSLKDSEYSLVLVQGPDGNPRTGLTKTPVNLRPLDDVAKLYKLGEISSKMEDKAARDARVVKSQLVLYEQAAESKEQPHPSFHKQVIDNSANLEILKKNSSILSMLYLKAINRSF